MDIYHWPILAAAAGAFASVYGAFAKFDADQSDENRKFTSDWLLGLKADDRQWSNSFKEIFTSIFGERHFSLKCFFRSVALTAALLACFWVYFFITNYPFPDFPVSHDNPVEMIRFLLPTIMNTLFIAIVADYLSLWKTRIVLTRLNLFNNGIIAILIVILDALATLVIYAIIFTMTSAYRYDSIMSIEDEPSFIGYITKTFIQVIVSELWPSLNLDPEFIQTQYTDPFRLLYLAPLFTSAWVWVYLLVAYGMRAVNHIPPLLGVLSKVLDVKSHPVKSIGYIAGLASAIIVGLFSFV